jgi:hypothetical protein
MTVSVTDPIPFLSWRTIHEKVVLLRQLFVILSIALSQLGPFVSPVDKRSIRDMLVQLETVLLSENAASATRIQVAFAPFQNGPESLQTRLEQQKLEDTLENDPEFINTVMSINK